MRHVDAFFTDEFRKQMRKIKDTATLDRLRKAIESILLNPEKGKDLHGYLAGKQSVRITPFRIVFEQKAGGVLFCTFEHRKWVYR